MKTMNPQDVLFFLIEQRKQPMHVAALQIYTPPKGAGDDFVQELYQSWRTHLPANTPLNLRPVNQLGRWLWDEDQEFDLDYHLRHLALPRPGRIRELLVLVSQLHATLLDRNRPLWECYLIGGLADGRFALYFKMHHGLVDGVTGMRMVNAALSTQAKEIKPPIWAQVHAKPGKAAALPVAKKSVLQPLYDAWQTGSEVLPGLGSGLLDVVRGELGKGMGGITLPRQAPPTPFNVEITGSRRFVAQSYSLERIKCIGAVANATVNDVTLALCASALRRYLQTHDALPEKSLTAMVPVSLHGETSKGGNQVGLILANLATDVADPVQRLATIVASTSAAKKRLKAMSRVEKMAHAAMTLAPMVPGTLTGGSRKRPVFNVIISNVPGPQETLYLNGARLDEAYPVSIPTDYQALNITVSGNGDNLGFGFTACRRSVPGLQRMVDHIETALCELEAALIPATARRKTRSATTKASVTTARKTPIPAGKPGVGE